MVLVIVGQIWRRGSPSRRLGRVCAGATLQRVVLASPVTAGNKLLLLRLLSAQGSYAAARASTWKILERKQDSRYSMEGHLCASGSISERTQSSSPS